MFPNLLHLTIVVVVVVIVCCSDGVNSQKSPCPQVFEYKYDGFYSYGIVRLPAAIGANNLQIKLALERAPEGKSAVITIQDSDSEVIKRLQTGGNIKYKIDFPSGISLIPEIMSIKLNNKEYCDNSDGTTYLTILTAQFNVALSSPGGAKPTVRPIQQARPKPSGSGATLNFDPETVLRPSDSHSISSRPSTSNTLNRVQDDWLHSFKFNNVCGIKDAQAIHTVIGGRDTIPNEFPWLAALFDNKRTYFCGGSLVSDRHIITAAHCTANRQWVIVELGKHDLENKSEDGVALRISQNIVNHPEYTPNTGHADISIITLSEKLSFTNKIRPICLWPFDSHHVGTVGTVAGWGVDMSGETTSTPMAADVDIVSDTECRNSHELFSTITSETTFCAGGKKKGPCSGDSGSGFVVETNNRWYLKGIISTSIRKGIMSCDVSKFAVYCDVGKYLNWFETYLLSA